MNDEQSEIHGLTFHPASRRLVAVKRTYLTNQIYRDTPIINKSFDQLCQNYIEKASIEISGAVSIILNGIISASDQKMEVSEERNQLLLNATTSISSAFILARAGYTVQPGIIIRTILETVSTAIHLFERPQDYQKFKDGKLNSAKTIAAAKKAIPIFGHIYRSFSENFVHLGEIHRTPHLVRPYKAVNEPLYLTLSSIGIAITTIKIAAELLNFNIVHEHCYWKPCDTGFVYDPTPEAIARMKALIEPEFREPENSQLKP